MSQFAVEAHQLIKKFPARPGTGDKPVEGGSAPSPKKKRGLFGKKEPKTMFTAVSGVDIQIERGEIFGHDVDQPWRDDDVEDSVPERRPQRITEYELETRARRRGCGELAQDRMVVQCSRRERKLVER